ncbi:Imm21 family immunity protein [Streptomyces sp. NPDC059262]|uniref:Imm21 family immunity protein n=1 Tax=Streptomyces sp. NPDC059262 TaxID=3346797 RepID=UPI0036874A6B
MTKTIPGSVGPSHQAFCGPGVDRAFSERPGSAVSFCFPHEHRAFLRWLAADTETELKAAARTVLADASTQREECGTRASDSPVTLTDSARTAAESGIEYPGGGMPTQASVPLPASRWRVCATHTKADEETCGAPNIKRMGKLR